MWSKHSCLIDPISLSTCPFCHGEWGIAAGPGGIFGSGWAGGGGFGDAFGGYYTVFGQVQVTTTEFDAAGNQMWSVTDSGWFSYLSWGASAGGLGATNNLPYAIAQYEGAFGKFDPSDPNVHKYVEGPYHVCTGEKCAVATALDTGTHCYVPTGCSLLPVQSGDISFAGPGFIITYVDYSNAMITNFTIPYLHVQNPGVVVIGFYQSGNSVYVTFTGVGQGPMPQTTQSWAGAVWSSTAAQMAGYWTLKYGW